MYKCYICKEAGYHVECVIKDVVKQFYGSSLHSMLKNMHPELVEKYELLAQMKAVSIVMSVEEQEETNYE